MLCILAAVGIYGGCLVYQGTACWSWNGLIILAATPIVAAVLRHK